MIYSCNLPWIIQPLNKSWRMQKTCLYISAYMITKTPKHHSEQRTAPSLLWKKTLSANGKHRKKRATAFNISRNMNKKGFTVCRHPSPSLKKMHGTQQVNNHTSTLWYDPHRSGHEWHSPPRHSPPCSALGGCHRAALCATQHTDQ
jgi:hypothetical protein